MYIVPKGTFVYRLPYNPFWKPTITEEWGRYINQLKADYRVATDNQLTDKICVQTEFDWYFDKLLDCYCPLTTNESHGLVLLQSHKHFGFIVRRTWVKETEAR